MPEKVAGMSLDSLDSDSLGPDPACPDCHGTGALLDPFDGTYSIECFCVTHVYPVIDIQPRLPGMRDEDIAPCPVCGRIGFHKMSCTRNYWFGVISG